MVTRNKLIVERAETLEDRTLLSATQLFLGSESPFDAVTYDSENGVLTFESAATNWDVAKVDGVEINGVGYRFSLSQLGRNGGAAALEAGELDLAAPTSFKFTSEPDGGETLFDLTSEPLTSTPNPVELASDVTPLAGAGSSEPAAGSELLRSGSILPKIDFEISSQNTLDFSTNQRIDDFKVPNDIDLIKINNDVTLQGRFIVGGGRENPLIIKGEGEGSVIEGVPDKSRSDFGGVGGGVAIDATDSNVPIYLLDFKSLNPHGYHMRAISQPVYASNVQLIEEDPSNTRGNTDGFSGGGGSIYENSVVDTMDDSFKFYYGDYTLKDVQIVHNRNGAPFQFGWDDMDGAILNIRMDGVTVQGNSPEIYNQGVFSWAGGDTKPTTGQRTRNVILEGEGLQVSTNPQMATPPLYRFGDTVNNKTLQISGAGAEELAPSNQNVRNEGGTNNGISMT